MDVATLMLMFLGVPILLFALFRRREEEPRFHHSMAQHANDEPEAPRPARSQRMAHHPS